MQGNIQFLMSMEIIYAHEGLLILYIFIHSSAVTILITVLTLACFYVRLSVRQHDNSKTRRSMSLKFGMWVTIVKGKNPFEF